MRRLISSSRRTGCGSSMAGPPREEQMAGRGGGAHAAMKGEDVANAQHDVVGDISVGDGGDGDDAETISPRMVRVL